MMQGIAYIIRHNFFCLKLICPDIKRLCLIKNHPGFFLPDHDIHGGKNAFDQCSQVKTLHNSCVFSGFQLIQRKKILYQLIHLCSDAGMPRTSDPGEQIVKDATFGRHYGNAGAGCQCLGDGAGGSRGSDTARFAFEGFLPVP